jgi:YVTN family beta-propeller protein
VQRISFSPGSKPWMLRVAPDGKTVWVQVGLEGTNVVLDTATMAVLQTAVVGKQPFINGFQPGGPHGLVTHAADTFIAVIDRQGREVKRIEVGTPQGEVSFTPDGATAFVTVPPADEVLAIDMAQLAIVARIPTGKQPLGVVLLDPERGPVPNPPPTGSGGNLPGLPNTGGGGAAGGQGGWLLTLGGLAVLGGLGLRLRRGRREQTDYRRFDG